MIEGMCMVVTMDAFPVKGEGKCGKMRTCSPISLLYNPAHMATELNFKQELVGCF